MLRIIRQYIFRYRVIICAYKTKYTLLRKNYISRKSNTPTHSYIYINTTNLKGGAALIAYNLHKEQQKRNHASHVIVETKYGDDDSVHILRAQNSKKQYKLHQAQRILQWQYFFHLASMDLSTFPFYAHAGIVHLHNLHSWNGYFSPFALPVLSAQKRVVWTLHDMHAVTGHCAYSFACEKWKTGCDNCPQLDTYPKLTKDTAAFIWKTKKRIYKSCDMHIVVPSKWLQNIVSQSILSHLPCTFIYNGVDTNTYKPHNKQKVRTLLELPHNKIIILFSADLGVENPFKGGEYIMQLIQKYSKNSQLLFVNIGGDVHVEKQEHIWNIPYITKAEDMAHWYSAADVYVYPSLADNCPLAILEAMACGLPIVTFNTGGIPELVLHNETGYIADYKNFDDLCAGFEMLINNADMRELLSKKGVERVRNFFTIETMNEAYQTLYDRL